uniref:dihydrolipoyllysine-residue succinyltransferase n=3 Tax=Aplanochytrium stocchinoi TaxID=215587 RepID=A0A6S8AMK0_9STRA|eukprot:CAMPEP_0204825704 /NCGR_PEP_ID=MMETSP1346-20131115/3532_1 /ASSEMBLY_ACC=CAM_ASM_000771 /TAXON_ID=215587 /ORGANISM="Aplanochytrium stocchinoi, Strain GSBS06" /LENGTH=420 /DNA_ID=CAMNT_0051953419 /DNA_START=137 /DNA_END=1399 /DNA_ORIENTATION=-
MLKSVLLGAARAGSVSTRSLKSSRVVNVNGFAFQSQIIFLRSFSSNPVDIPLPPLADSIDRGILASWEKKVGDYVAVDETIAVIDTDKVSVDVKSPEGGELIETLAEEGDDLEVGQIIARIMPKEAPAGAEKPADAAAIAASTSPPAPSAPAAEKAPTPAPTAAAHTPAPKAATPTLAPAVPASVPGSREKKMVKMTPMRMKIASRLKESQNTAASLTTFNEIDMSNLMAMRNKYKDTFLNKHGVKLGFMSAFVAAATAALQEIPAVNGRIEDDHIVYNEFIDISVAVSSPRGLVVPVLRNCETKSFADIEANIVELGTKARNNTITLEDMAGGTFTVTNGGIFGSLMSTPMINQPQSAILGMHAIKERPVVVNGEIVIRPMMYVALTYDHRLIDGRESVTFLKSIKEKVEDPERLLLGL